MNRLKRLWQWLRGKTYLVKPGDDLRSVLNAARPGDVIKLMPGTYIDQSYVYTNGQWVEGDIEE